MFKNWSTYELIKNNFSNDIIHCLTHQNEYKWLDLKEAYLNLMYSRENPTFYQDTGNDVNIYLDRIYTTFLLLWS